MNREALYYKSLDTLIEAYYNDELLHEDCRSCAVGHLLMETADEMGVDNALWRTKFHTTFCPKQNRIVQLYDMPILDGKMGKSAYGKLLNAEFKAAGETLLNHAPYTWQELAIIEFAFENISRKGEDHVFEGLMQVVKALDWIHENERVDSESLLSRINLHV